MTVRKYDYRFRLKTGAICIANYFQIPVIIKKKTNMHTVLELSVILYAYKT